MIINGENLCESIETHDGPVALMGRLPDSVVPMKKQELLALIKVADKFGVKARAISCDSSALSYYKRATGKTVGKPVLIVMKDV